MMRKYIGIKSSRVMDVGFWESIKIYDVIGNIEVVQNTKIRLKNGVYVVLFCIQVVAKIEQVVSVGLFGNDDFAPKMMVMGGAEPDQVVNLAGNSIIVVEGDTELILRNMSKGIIDCYEMSLSICSI